MADPPKDDKGTPPPKDDKSLEGEGRDGDEGGDEGGEISRGELEDMVNAAVAAALKPAGDPPKEDKPAGGKRPTARDDEDRVRAMVEEQVAKVRKDDEIVGRLAKVEEKLVEQPPAHTPFLRKLIWGADR